MPDLAFAIYELLWLVIFAFALAHSARKYGKGWTAAFFAPALFWGFLLEFASQEIFARYHYGGGFLVYALNVPLCISLAWAALIYFGYVFASHDLKIKNPLKAGVVAAIPLAAMDFFLFEPLAKIFGYWVWTPESVWFGSPLGNVYGWFFVVVLYVAAFVYLESVRGGWKKRLAFNFALILPRLMVLMALLQAWANLFGNL